MIYKGPGLRKIGVKTRKTTITISYNSYPKNMPTYPKNVLKYPKYPMIKIMSLVTLNVIYSSNESS